MCVHIAALELNFECVPHIAALELLLCASLCNIHTHIAVSSTQGIDKHLCRPSWVYKMLQIHLESQQSDK